jgi:hypothetical protein
MKRRTQSDVAAVLVFAVLLLATGVFVLTGIAQLAATQALIGQGEWQALDRRIRLENSRAMARQFILARMFNGVVADPITFVDASLGGFSLSPISSTNTGGDYWTTLSTTNTNVNLKINPFTLMERGGFYRVVVPGKLYSETGATNNGVDWNFQVRTRSPITAGYPVVQQLPASNNVASLVGAVPHIDMTKNEQFIGFHDMARMRVSSVTNTAVDATGYEGFLDVPIGVAAAGLFTNAQPALYGAGATNLKMVVDLGADDPENLNQVLVYEVPASFPYVDTNAVPPTTNNLPVVAVELEGMGDDYSRRKPLQVVVPAALINVRTLILTSFNDKQYGRPVYFSYHRATNSEVTLQVDTTNATWTKKWRIGITAAHCNIEFAGPVTIVGGVRTDGTISGNPSLEQERDPGGLDYIADRMMWLEDYKTP